MTVQASGTIEGFSGELLRPGDAGYDDARSIFNGLVDKRAALIARCTSAEDVRAALAHARATGHEVSVRGGGHNVAGTAVTDGGVMIDLSPLRAIDVDPQARTARAGAGLTWGDLNEATQAHGLAVTGGVISTTGIAGLTLGGGFGWTMPKFGLAADNLLSADVVTADGRILTASEDENTDLFWGLRGGGGNFGVVTTFEYRLHPVGPMITGGLVLHPFPAARDLLRFFREFTADISDDLMMVAALLHAPDGTKVAGIAACHVGTPEEAERELAPVRAFGTPIDVQLGPMPYTAVNQMLDEGFPPGLMNYWKSTFVRPEDGAIDAIVDGFAACPSPRSSMVVEHFHGQVTRIPLEATAIPLREAAYNCAILALWEDPAATDTNVAWARDRYATLEPFATGVRYVNYLGDDDVGVRGAFSGYDRLVELKRKYDPDNVFHLNQNIRPTGETDVSPVSPLPS